MEKMKYSILVTLSLCIVGLISCSSGQVLIQPQLTGNEKLLRHVSGEPACGFIGIGPTAYNFIPIMLSSRVERAYLNAIAGAPGATAITNITIEENWYWVVVGSVRCLKISGDAVQ